MVFARSQDLFVREVVMQIVVARKELPHECGIVGFILHTFLNDCLMLPFPRFFLQSDCIFNQALHQFLLGNVCPFFDIL